MEINDIEGTRARPRRIIKSVAKDILRNEDIEGSSPKGVKVRD